MLFQASQLRARLGAFYLSRILELFLTMCMSVCGSVHVTIVPTDCVGLCMRVCRLQSVWVCTCECTISRGCGFVQVSVVSSEAIVTP